VVAGEAIEVHSSLSSFGWVEGGAEAVVTALLAVVGCEGAVVMSAYPVSLPVPVSESERALGVQWKVRRLDPNGAGRTGMGAIADAFRRRDDVVLGTGLHRVCAWGKEAAAHAARGYAHLLDLDGRVLLLGVGIGRMSSMHQAEGRVSLPDRIQRLFEAPRDLASRYDAAEWVIGYGSAPLDPWQTVWEQALELGLISRGAIGRSECALLRARPVVALYEGLLRHDPLGAYGLGS
jgi:aminoglycoside 3-N-acetyltransferase